LRAGVLGLLKDNQYGLVGLSQLQPGRPLHEWIKVIKVFELKKAVEILISYGIMIWKQEISVYQKRCGGMSGMATDHNGSRRITCGVYYRDLKLSSALLKCYLPALNTN
jgi:hypothetical protein